MNEVFVPPTQKGRDRKDAILAVASELFLANGYSDVTLDDVIEKAGGSRVSIYKAFGGKQQLFEAVIEAACDDFESRLFAIQYSHLPFEAGFRHLAEIYINMALDQQHLQFYRVVLGNASRFPNIGSIWYVRGVQAVSEVFFRFLSFHLKGEAIGPETLRTLSDSVQGSLVFCLLSAATVLQTPPTEQQKSAAIDSSARMATLAYNALRSHEGQSD
ncbi:TetR/AcrR family transcriptional regulator [Pseudomonas kitaguniensis]|uniref:TetR/AcrR family transcriptional regulator n=1 Tax=Pseudomonas kitaguniensis TaxID=2607908 RepID=UPI003D0896CB